MMKFAADRPGPIPKRPPASSWRLRATPAEYSAGLKLAIERGWLEPHDSGTYVKFTQAGADLFG